MYSSQIIRKIKAFTLVEVLVVIVILGIIASIVLPKYVDLKRNAKIGVLQGIAGTLRSTATLVKAKARAQGLTPAPANPGGNQQTQYVVNFGFGSAEVDWRNLCPESRAELGDQLSMLDFINLSGDDLSAVFNNQYTLIGYDIPGFNAAPNLGCYVIYDSFGDPDCTVTFRTAEC